MRRCLAAWRVDSCSRARRSRRKNCCWSSSEIRQALESHEVAVMTRLVCVVFAGMLLAPLSAQRGAAPDPLVKENATTRVAPHTYVIGDDNVPLVPNVGI